MTLLKNKKILITGVISNRSIAFGIAKSCKEQGAILALTYANEKLKDRVLELSEELNCNICLKCDVNSDDSIENLKNEISNYWHNIDGFVHSIAFANKDAISDKFLDGMNRENFRIAHEVSSYSLPALVKALLPLMHSKTSIVTLSYIGSTRYVPNYNMMGLAKASLESSIKYIANDLGSQGIRANVISSGPIKTLAASGIKDFSKILKHVENNAPLKRNVTITDVGNAAVFLLSDLSSGITGEILNVDAGFSNVVGIS
ncbi:enoyl-[acyl-carrier protein] reductase I [Candidatus Kinetoplastibacterium desouzaii TCC079E]|uniref:Enoyl-[acyl-carrier-protein] reductase [NADH] n=1 Tax=Candidatus Kinetoplastidibacterium desouzai TCC079E TaxID=1208919 RepID=M1LSQ9_9PROT|nr:enoyl-ACP reductase [Candidatus Kinetoplastibacterium desouzaii]AGF47146.1 enoyl-[acyl-carrier protein] reductase I [Candidatus Kinetoplastibacterium desouzaii TCC079E]